MPIILCCAGFCPLTRRDNEEEERCTCKIFADGEKVRRGASEGEKGPAR